MTQIIFHITLIAVCSVWFTEHGIMPKIKLLLYRARAIKSIYSPVKPFDCPLCLAWWTGLIYFCNTQGWVGIVCAACTSLLAVWISKKLAP